MEFPVGFSFAKEIAIFDHKIDSLFLTFLFMKPLAIVLKISFLVTFITETLTKRYFIAEFFASKVYLRKLTQSDSFNLSELATAELT